MFEEGRAGNKGKENRDVNKEDAATRRPPSGKSKSARWVLFSAGDCFFVSYILNVMKACREEFSLSSLN